MPQRSQAVHDQPTSDDPHGKGMYPHITLSTANGSILMLIELRLGPLTQIALTRQGSCGWASGMLCALRALSCFLTTQDSFTPPSLWPGPLFWRENITAAFLQGAGKKTLDIRVLSSTASRCILHVEQHHTPAQYGRETLRLLSCVFCVQHLLASTVCPYGSQATCSTCSKLVCRQPSYLSESLLYPGVLV